MGGPDRKELAELVSRLSVVHGRFTLSSGKEADYYVDLRRATLHHRASALIGALMRELTSDWDYAVYTGAYCPGVTWRDIGQNSNIIESNIGPHRYVWQPNSNSYLVHIQFKYC